MNFPSHSLKLKVGIRDRKSFPNDDDALGSRLAEIMLKALRTGIPAPTFVVFRSDIVEFFSLLQVRNQGFPLLFFMAAAAGQEDVDCTALMCVSVLKEMGVSIGRAGSVFIEWPDNRWWHGYYHLNMQNYPIEDVPMVIRKAEDGHPRPDGFGGWFSRARYFRLRLQRENSDAGSTPVNIH